MYTDWVTAVSTSNVDKSRNGAKPFQGQVRQEREHKDTTLVEAKLRRFLKGSFGWYRTDSRPFEVRSVGDL